jgi:flagellar assembly protein FliH
MPSKLLTGTQAGTASSLSPLSWPDSRRTPVRPTPPAEKNDDASFQEIQQLRAKVTELGLSSEQAARKAHDTGYRAGELAARQALEGEAQATTEQLARTIAEVTSTREQIMRRAEADTVRLSLEIARRVLHRELSVDPSAIEALVKAALEKLHNHEIYRVRLHPDQEALVRRYLQQLGRNLEIVSDPTQSRGGVLFEISRGTLDASVETQLKEIERGLADEMDLRK